MQIFRGVANTMEVLNHCLNFYVFCMASSEYSRAFLHTCNCFRMCVWWKWWVRNTNCSHCLRPIARRLTIDNSSALQLPSVVLRSARNARASVAQPNMSRVEAHDRASSKCLSYQRVLRICVLFFNQKSFVFRMFARSKFILCVGKSNNDFEALF